MSDLNKSSQFNFDDNFDQETFRRLQQQNRELIELAKQISKEGKEAHPIVSHNYWGKIGLWLKELFTVDSTKLYGKAYVTKEIQSHSRMVADMGTVANAINIATALPLLLIAMADIPFFGLFLALGTASGLLKFSNKAVEIAAAKKPGNQFWSEVGLAGVIFLNLIQSVVSGVGTQLVLDKSGIANHFADRMVYEQTIAPLEARVNNYQFDPNAIPSKKECQALETELPKVEANTSESSRLYEQAYGRYAEAQLPLKERSYYSSPPNQWPHCPRAKYEEARLTSRLSTAQQELQEAQAKVADKGGLAYLRKEKPDIYDRYFDEVGELKSGMQATTTAVEMFWENLVTGNWASLGLSMYIFGLSVITSAIAVTLVATHSQREDIQMSWSPAVAQEKESYLKEMRKKTFRGRLLRLNSNAVGSLVV